MANKAKILLTRRWPAQVEAALGRHFDTRLNIQDRPLTQSQLQEAMKQYDALCPCVTDPIGRAVLETPGRRVALVANYGVGYNHIDVAAARELGVLVSNTPDVLSEATADLAMTLILMVARRAGEGERHLRAGHWQGWYPTHMMGSMVTGKTLGVVGMGRIGLALARKAHGGFGMPILYHNRRPLAAKDLKGLGKVRYCETLEELLENADFVSLHCPAGPDTRHLINAESLTKLKPGAFLINTARGDVVDEAALFDALRQGRLGGAGLDVYEREPLVPEAFKRLDNVVLLPHLGSATLETRVAMGMRVLDNLLAWSRGEAPPDRVA